MSKSLAAMILIVILFAYVLGAMTWNSGAWTWLRGPTPTPPRGYGYPISNELPEYATKAAATKQAAAATAKASIPAWWAWGH